MAQTHLTTHASRLLRGVAVIKRINLLAFLWGFAEATLFFIVPDVLLSLVGLQNLRKGTIAAIYALFGAVLGGIAMFVWGMWQLERIVVVLDSIPAIRPKDLTLVHDTLHQNGIRTILLGPLLGIPYKIYAAYAHQITSILPFILISFPARIVRFLIMATAAPALLNRLFPSLSHKHRSRVMLTFWLLFYTGYFISRQP